MQQADKQGQHNKKGGEQLMKTEQLILNKGGGANQCTKSIGWGCVTKTMEVAMLMYAWYEEGRGELCMNQNFSGSVRE